MIDDPRFLACLPYTLAQECPHPDNWTNPANFSNDAHDPGGKTMCGIIQREYDAWRKNQGLTTRDVRQLTKDEGYAIYAANYWLPECPKLPAGLDLQFFDEAVNAGPFEATKVLQCILGVTIDGEWGPATDRAVSGITISPTIVKAFTTRRLAVYQQMNGFRYFGRDWIMRTQTIGAAALKMIGMPAAPPALPTAPPAPAYDLAWVQTQLNHLGAPPLLVDGRPGPRTNAAVRVFQAWHGLVVDGNPGPKTIAALVKEVGADH
jgi:lysozyme family protein